MTLLAGLVPALRATRVPPIAAVREGAALPQSRLAPARPYTAGVVIAARRSPLIAAGVFARRLHQAVLVPMGAGTLLLFLGVAMISPPSRPAAGLASSAGPPRLGGSAGRLARRTPCATPPARRPPRPR